MAKKTTTKKAAVSKDNDKKQVEEDTPMTDAASTEEKKDDNKKQEETTTATASTTEKGKEEGEKKEEEKKEEKAEEKKEEGEEKKEEKAETKTKGAKGKAKGKKAAAEPTKVTKPTKVREAKKREKKIHYEEVEDKWNGWKEIYFVGTEWDQYDNIFKYDWDFDHLEEKLFEGDFVGKNVYIFGATEPQLVQLKKDNPSGTSVIPIPVLIVIVSDMPPPAELGIKSVQMVEEKIVPMREMKMDWVPFIPRTAVRLDKEKPNIYLLKCSRRRQAIARMKIEDVKKYEYCMPHIPSLDESANDEEKSTEVEIIMTVGGKGLSFTFDWEMDEVDEFMDELAKEHELNDEQKEEVKKEIKTRVSEQKKKQKEAKEARLKKLAEIPQKVKDSIKNMKKYKFYPQNDEPVIEPCKVAYINRYYGKADEVF